MVHLFSLQARLTRGLAQRRRLFPGFFPHLFSTVHVEDGASKATLDRLRVAVGAQLRSRRRAEVTCSISGLA